MKSSFLIFLSCAALTSKAQDSTAVVRLNGVVRELDSGHPLPFCVVYVQSGQEQIGAWSTDFDGRFFICICRDQLLVKDAVLRVAQVNFAPAEVTLFAAVTEPIAIDLVQVNPSLKVTRVDAEKWRLDYMMEHGFPWSPCGLLDEPVQWRHCDGTIKTDVTPPDGCGWEQFK